MRAAAEALVLVALPDGTCGAFAMADVVAARARAVSMGFGPGQGTERKAEAPERLLNSRELAELIGIGDTLVEQMARDGRLPHLRIGKALRFEPGAVLAALRKAQHEV
jgi:excisionase family DNA binding protein